MRKTIILFSALALVAFSGVVFAEEAATKTLEEREAAKADRQSKIKERCALTQQKIAEKVSNFDAKKEKHMAVYENMNDRISKFIEKFSEDGYDTSQLSSDLETLNEKIQKFSDDYAAYVAKLKEAKDMACGKSGGEFKATIVEARALLKTAHQDAMDIRVYVRTVILPDIRSLKEQKAEDKSETDEDSSEDESADEDES